MSADPTKAPTATPRVLVLGGTGDARVLAARLAARGISAISSLAGRTAQPALPDGEVRIGGFGGVAGLEQYLTRQRIAAVIDATHPFAARMTAHAVAACAARGVPLLVLDRPPWTRVPGDRWIDVASVAEAAGIVESLGERIFLTVGRQELAPFAALRRAWFLIRSIDPPDVPLPPAHELLLDRGPFTPPAEEDLLRRYRIDVIVSKNSGGATTYAKIAAARALKLPVVMVSRPPRGDVPTAGTVEQAVAWLEGLVHDPSHAGAPDPAEATAATGSADAPDAPGLD